MKNTIAIAALVLVIFGIESCSQNNNNSNCGNSPQWTKLNLPTESAWVYTFCSVGNELIIGTGRGGYKSSDGGTTWVNITSSIKADVLATNVTAIYPYDTNSVNVFSDGIALYAVVNRDPNIYSGVSPAKIFKSVNSGASWSPFANNSSYRSMVGRVESLSFINGLVFIVDGRKLVFSSSDGGNNWVEAYNPNNLNCSIADVTVGDRCFVVTDGISYFSTFCNQLVKFSANGQNITTLTLPKRIDNLVAIGSKLFCSSTEYYDNEYVYSVTVSNSVANSAIINNGIEFKYTPKQVGSFSVIGSSLYLGITDRIFKSDDSGVTWVQVGCDLSKSDQIYPKIVLKNGSFLYALAPQGLYKLPN